MKLGAKLKALLGFVVLATVASAAVYAATVPPPPPDDAPTQEPPLPVPAKPLTFDEEVQLKQSLNQQHRMDGSEVVLRGTSTKGKVIEIAGKPVRLPDDAQLDGLIISVDCVPGQVCPETPLYVITRRNSRIFVSVPTGTAYDKSVAPGEDSAFDFLKGVIKEGAGR